MLPCPNLAHLSFSLCWLNPTLLLDKQKHRQRDYIHLLPSQAQPPPLVLYPQSHLLNKFCAAQSNLNETVESTTAPLALLCPSSHRSLFLSCTSISLSLRFLISHFPPSTLTSILSSLSLYTLTLYLLPSIYALFHFPISLLLLLIRHFLDNCYHYLSQNPYF